MIRPEELVKQKIVSLPFPENPNNVAVEQTLDNLNPNSPKWWQNHPFLSSLTAISKQHDNHGLSPAFAPSAKIGTQIASLTQQLEFDRPIQTIGIYSISQSQLPETLLEQLSSATRDQVLVTIPQSTLFYLSAGPEPHIFGIERYSEEVITYCGHHYLVEYLEDEDRLEVAVEDNEFDEYFGDLSSLISKVVINYLLSLWQEIIQSIFPEEQELMIHQSKFKCQSQDCFYIFAITNRSSIILAIQEGIS